MTFGNITVPMTALGILQEEVEHEEWLSEYLSEGPSGHFRRGKPEAYPCLGCFMTADFDYCAAGEISLRGRGAARAIQVFSA